MAKTSDTDLTAHGTAPGPVLEFRDVSFSYDGATVLEHVSLGVERGSFTALLGPNGSGKTTLMKLALGMLQPKEGSISLFGKPPGEFRGWHRVGYVPQVLTGIWSRFPVTVAETVSQGLYRGVSPLAFWRRSDPPNVMNALETAGVAGLKGQRLASLSVGQQQRVLVARALVRSPELLVLDEPAAGIDASGEEQLYSLLRRLNEEQQMTIVLVTHDIGAVMQEVATVACLNRSLFFHGPSHALTREELSRLYGFPVDVLLHDALHEHR